MPEQVAWNCTSAVSKTMTRPAAPTRARNQGLKLAIGAAALAATIGGWAAFTAQAPQATTAPAAAVAQPPAWLREPPAIPTLQPLPGQSAATTADTAAAPARLSPSVPLARPAPITVTRSSR